MSTMHAPPAHLHRRHVDVWLVVAIGLGAAFVALGTWVIVDRTAGADTATQDATALIDDSAAAFTAGDPAGVASTFAPNGVIWSMGTTYAGVKAIQALADGSFWAERIAPVTVDGEYATTFVRLTSGQDTGKTLSVFQIRDGKIVRQWNFVPGQTAPFDNAVAS